MRLSALAVCTLQSLLMTPPLPLPSRPSLPTLRCCQSLFPAYAHLREDKCGNAFVAQTSTQVQLNGTKGVGPRPNLESSVRYREMDTQFRGF